MGVDDIGDPARDALIADPRRDPAERGEADMVVAPVDAVLVVIGIARPVIKMRRIDGDQLEPRALAHQHPHRAAIAVGVKRNPGRLEVSPDRGVMRQQHPDVEAELHQRQRQRADDIGEATCLDQRVALGSDE